MSITILNYHDQAFVDQINAEAAARAEAERAAAEAAKAQAYEQLEEKKQEIMSGAEITSENITEAQQESGFKIIAEFICNEDIAVQEKLIIE